MVFTQASLWSPSPPAYPYFKDGTAASAQVLQYDASGTTRLVGVNWDITDGGRCFFSTNGGTSYTYAESTAAFPQGAVARILGSGDAHVSGTATATGIQFHYRTALSATGAYTTENVASTSWTNSPATMYVRTDGSVVIFYNGIDSGSNRTLYVRVRTGTNTYTAAQTVSSASAGAPRIFGSGNRAYLFWEEGNITKFRCLNASNVLSTTYSFGYKISFQETSFNYGGYNYTGCLDNRDNSLSAVYWNDSDDPVINIELVNSSVDAVAGFPDSNATNDTGGFYTTGNPANGDMWIAWKASGAPSHQYGTVWAVKKTSGGWWGSVIKLHEATGLDTFVIDHMGGLYYEQKNSKDALFYPAITYYYSGGYWVSGKVYGAYWPDGVGDFGGSGSGALSLSGTALTGGFDTPPNNIVYESTTSSWEVIDNGWKSGRKNFARIGTTLYVLSNIATSSYGEFHYSTDEGETWTRASAGSSYLFNNPAGLVEIGSGGVAFLGDSGDGAGNYTLTYLYPNTAAPTSGTHFSAESTGITSEWFHNKGGSLVQRTSGEIVALGSGAYFTSMGTDYQKVHYAKRTGTNTWAAPVMLGHTGTIHNTDFVTAVAHGNRIHTWFAISGATQYYRRTLSATDVLSTIATSTASPVASTGMSNVVFVGNTGYYLYHSSSTTVQFVSFNADNDAPTETSVNSFTRTAYTSTGAPSWTPLAYDAVDSTFYALYSVGTNVFLTSRTTGAWTSPTMVYLGLTGSTLILSGAEVYTKSDGSRVLAYVIYENPTGTATGQHGRQRYVEYVIDPGTPPVIGGDFIGAGEGTFTVPTRTPGVSGSIALSGSGTLTLSGTPGFSGSVSPNGAGTLTANGIAVQLGSGTLSGSGALVLAGTPALAQISGYTGTGTLTLVGSLSVALSLDLAGAGTLTYTTLATPAQTLPLAGSGELVTTAAVLLEPPTDITITVVSPTQLDLSWTAAPSATGYDIERDGIIIAEYHQGTSYSDTNLTEGTTYTYRVRSQKVVTE